MNETKRNKALIGITGKHRKEHRDSIDRTMSAAMENTRKSIASRSGFLIAL